MAPPNRTRRVLADIGAGMSIVAAALAIRALLGSLLGRDDPYLTMLVAVLALAAWRGLRVALPALLVGWLAGYALFRAPPGAVLPISAADWTDSALFLTMGALAAVISATSYSALARARAAEAELRQQHERLSLALSAGRMGTWEWEPATNGVAWSPELRALHALPPDFDGDLFEYGLSIVHKDDQPALQRTVERHLASRTEFEAEVRVRIAGDEKWVNIRGRPVRGENGRVRVLGATMDITARKAVEAELRLALDGLRYVTDAARVGMWDWNAATGRTYWSPIAYDIMGVRRGEAVSYARFLDCINPEDRPQVERVVQECIDRGGDFDVEYRVLLPGREVRWAEVKGRAGSVNGRVVRLAGIVLDITERKHAELQAAEHRERLSSALAAAGMGIWEWNPQQQTIEWSPEMYDLYGMPRGDSGDLIERAWAAVHEDDRDRVRDSIAERVAADAEFEVEYRLESGGRERWVTTRGRGLRLADGSQRVFGVVADITARKQAEIRLAHAEERFRAAQDLSLDAFTILRAVRGRDGAIIDFEWEHANPAAARALGRPAEELVGRRLLEVLPGNREDLFPRYVRVVETGEPHDIEVRYEAEGIAGWFRNMAVRQGDGVAVSFSDITARKTAESELRRHREQLEILVAERTAELEDLHRRARSAERLASLGTLAAGLGHDLANLLLPLRARLESLGQIELPRDARQDLDAAKDAIGYIQRLSTGLRLMAADPERESASPAATDLGAWWRDVEGVLRSVLPRGGSLEGDLPAGLGVAMRRHHLMQVVFNLVQNAAEAMAGQRDGVVRVQARESGDRAVLLTVSDNGPGMPPEVRLRCFEPYFSTKGRAVSTGMGLPLVRALVERVGGRVEADSESGGGARFQVLLPRAAGVSAHSEARLRALVSPLAGRAAALASTILESLGVAVDKRTEGGIDPDLWVAPAVNHGAVEAFLAARAGRCVVVCDERPPEAGRQQAGEMVIYVGREPRAAALRRALVEAAVRAAGAAGEVEDAVGRAGGRT